MNKKGGLVATARHVADLYRVDIAMRSFDQCPDDYHAIVSRLSDDVQLIFISRWKWILNLKTNRKALDRAFKRYDKRKKKLAKTESRVI